MNTQDLWDRSNPEKQPGVDLGILPRYAGHDDSVHPT